MTTPQSSTTRRDVIRAGWLLASGAALGGVAVPRLFGAGAPVSARGDDRSQTQTREAELGELHDLQTRVAEPNVCTPAATETPSPTETPVPATATATPVPPAAMGQELVYDETLALTVMSVAPVPSGGDIQPQGQFVRVNLTARNTSRRPVTFPFTDLLLIDAAGGAADVDIQASSALIVGGRLAIPIGIGDTEDRAVVFDVAIDAGTAFILESTKVPTFRVALAIEARG